MDKKIKKAWLKKLRSGNYRQCTDILKKKNKGQRIQYCCLGVLGTCIPQAYWDKDNNLWFDNEGSAYTLNHRLLNFVGLNCTQQNQLMRLNDGEMWSFKEIANYIEKNL